MNAEQRFKCIDCGKSWTGFKMEHCKECHETFNTTKAGDMHTAIAYTYAIIERGGVRQQVLEGESLGIDRSGKVLSEHNEQRYCLSAAEMRTKGMNQEKNGSWNMGGRAYIPKG